MKRFFGTAPTNWDLLDGQLHVYCIPEITSEFTHSLQKTASSLQGINSLALQPPEYYHATVQLLDWNLQQITPQQLKLLKTNLAAATSRLKAFTLDFAFPLVQEFAVETVAAPLPVWEQLVASIRQAATKSGCTLPAPPYGAHLSLAYGIAAGSDSPIQEALASTPVQPLFPLSYRFAACELVSVTQDRQRGIFSFTSLGHFPFQ